VLYFFGRGAEVFDANRDDVRIEVGERLMRDLRLRHEAAEYQDPHQEVGCDVVLSEPCDRPLQVEGSESEAASTNESGATSPSTTPSPIATPSTTRTAIPSLALSSEEMQTRSPAANPPLT
jgi:hypothetical protein